MREMKKTVLAATILIIVLFVGVVVGFYLTNQKSNTDQIDSSWVEDINQLLKNVTPITNSTEYSNPNVLLSYCRTYLYENGTSSLIEFGNAGNNVTDPVNTYLNNLLLKANLQLQQNGSISSDFLDKVLATDKVVEINYRLSTMQFGGQKRFSSCYFVVKDYLNEDLLGKMIVSEVGKQGLSLWAISK
jgi:hypothetical protein